MIDWSKPVRTKDEQLRGTLQTGRGPSDRRRVLIPPSRKYGGGEPTVYLYREDGSLMADKPSDFDLENYETI